MPALRIKYPKLGVITHVLRSERVTVGRAADNSIQIPHESISAHHAEIVTENGRCRLRDLQSTNHSRVNGDQVTEQELTAGCQIQFGAIECEFDPHATTTAREPLALPPPVAAPQLAVLENENRELRAHVTSLQRRFDILGSARLTAGRADHTPFAATSDALRGLTSERDDLRQQAAGLRLEVGRLREDLAVTIRERDAAREAAAGLQTERTGLQLELQHAESRTERLRSELIIATEFTTPPPRPPQPPARPPAVPPPAPPSALPPKPPAPLATTTAAAPLPTAPPVEPSPRRTPPLRAAEPSRLATHIATLRGHVLQLAAAPADRDLLIDAHLEIGRVLDHAATLCTHPLRRVASRFAALLASLTAHERIPATGTLRTLRHSAELLERLLDPSLSGAAADLPTAQVLAIDDDTELLSALTGLLGGAGLELSTCTTAEEAMIAIEALRFDTIIADIGLPGIAGTAFCAHARSRPAYRHTPILFLTGSDTLGKRAETSLSGGTEFIAKPFDTAELSLKVEAWTLKHQLHLV